MSALKKNALHRRRSKTGRSRAAASICGMNHDLSISIENANSIDNATLYRLRVLRRLWRRNWLRALRLPRLASRYGYHGSAAIACKSSLAVPTNSAVINRNLVRDDSHVEAFTKKQSHPTSAHRHTKRGGQEKEGTASIRYSAAVQGNFPLEIGCGSRQERRLSL